MNLYGLTVRTKLMAKHSDFYYTYKKRFEEAQKKPISQIKERAWLLENLAKELLNDLASEWLSRDEYEKEVGIIRQKEITKSIKTAEKHETEQHRILDERFAWSAAFLSDDNKEDETVEGDTYWFRDSEDEKPQFFPNSF